MSRILSIDFGLKRCGLAHTDELGMIASPLETVDSKELENYLARYISKHKPKTIVLGMPIGLKGEDTHITENVRLLHKRLESLYPDLKIALYDERFTSGMALQSMLTAGASKKQRAVKGNIDKVSAAIILQGYLESLAWEKRRS